VVIKLKRIILPIAILFIIAGCTTKTSEEIKWYKNEQKAIEEGLKDEGLKNKDILGKVKENGEEFIFYKQDNEDGVAVSVASIGRENDKYAFYNIDSYVQVKDNRNKNYSSEINWETHTQSDKNFIAYTGTIKGKKNYSIQTQLGLVTPYINKDTGIYYYIEPIK